MNLLIGIKQPDHIRYISVEYVPEFNKLISILRTFYKTRERVEALIELGNLNYLGLSPYKKSRGDSDPVNCEAKIRDKKLSPGKHGSCTAKDEKDFVKKSGHNTSGCCFLYEDNGWYILVGGHKESIQTIDKSVLEKGRLMEGLEVLKYNSDSEYNRLSTEEFHSWNEVRQSADETGITYYIFRSGKLLAVIAPTPKIPESQA